MKKGEIYTGIVEEVKFPNKGIVRVTGAWAAGAGANDAKDGTIPEKNHADAAVVTVKNVLPGQRISFRLTKKKHGRLEGNLLEILERSPLEAEPACPHYGICGGCTYQSVPYAEELKIKKEQVLSLLEAVLPDARGLFEEIRPSPRQYGYRNKMEYTFGDAYRDGPLALGMHKRGAFYDIVTVDDCRIAEPDFTKILRGTLDFFAERDIPYYHRMRHTGYLRHLLVRKGAFTGEILVDLVTSSQYGDAPGSAVSGQYGEADPGGAASEADLLRDFADMLLRLPLEGTVRGILHTVNDSVSDAVKNDRTDTLYGQDFFYETLLGQQFKITPFSFFQTNSGGAEALYSIVRDYIGGSLGDGGKTVYDLYSGTGTIAQIIAPAAGRTIGVEIVEEAVLAARENAARNGLDNCTFLAGDVLKVLDTIEEKPDLIILDPPRDGIHPKALDKIIGYGVDEMVYISCKPTSLQRDLKVLLERGYEVCRIACIDMFPGTSNVETVILLLSVEAKAGCYYLQGISQK